MKTAFRKLPLFAFALIAAAVLLAGVTTTRAVAQVSAPASLVPPPSSEAEMGLPPLADLPGEKTGKGLSGAEDKAVNQAKDVIKHIGSTDSLTLDDLNTTHQAIAKIEALIDLEKHLNELEKLRNEREGKSSFASAIPASALQPRFNQQAQAQPVHLGMPQAVPAVSLSSVEVMRVIGSDGHFTAVIKTADGQTRNVQTGDTVPGLGTIVAVSTMGVTVDQNHVHHTLKVKNVRMVFSGTP